jgi:hypothetical protein
VKKLRDFSDLHDRINPRIFLFFIPLYSFLLCVLFALRFYFMDRGITDANYVLWHVYHLQSVSACRDPKGAILARGKHSPVAGNLPLENRAPFGRFFGFFLFKDIYFMPEGL